MHLSVVSLTRNFFWIELLILLGKFIIPINSSLTAALSACIATLENLSRQNHVLNVAHLKIFLTESRKIGMEVLVIWTYKSALASPHSCI